MQVGRKAQGQDMSCGPVGTKTVACGSGHKASWTKDRVCRSLERQVRQAAWTECLVDRDEFALELVVGHRAVQED